jgi:hypothetical protein
MRYYFHLRDRRDLLRDREGVELAGLDAVRTTALTAARDTLSHEVKDGRVDLRCAIEVEDAAGALVHRLPFINAFELVRPA